MKDFSLVLFVGEKYDYLENVPNFKGRALIIENKGEEQPQLTESLVNLIRVGRLRIRKVTKPDNWEKKKQKKRKRVSRDEGQIHSKRRIVQSGDSLFDIATV
uniref:AlNc14C149G7460 protein n=1 Tax=Albugo laibachii Nc14 TaxID=890382 RepID=F0WLU7_9STRA|nr:AlNc14C149G7460 [Albugo laibachii Nc14]|eukprot:CCA22273.1 AlNc14C149G7460 [Albugo laibachii Nc14]